MNYESLEAAMEEVANVFHDVFTGSRSERSISVCFPSDGMSKGEILDRCNSEMSNATMDSVYGLSPEGNLIALHIEPAPIESSCIRLEKEGVQLTIPILFRHYYLLPNLYDGAVLTEDEFIEKASSLLATYSESEFIQMLKEDPALGSEDDELEYDEYDPFFGDCEDYYFDP